MSTTPSHLARITDDLTRAAIADTRRSLKRRRRATVASVALVLLALMTTTAVANGWLFGDTPAIQAAPQLAGTAANNQPSNDLVNGATWMTQEFQRLNADPNGAHPGILGSPIPNQTHLLLTNLGKDKRSLTAIPTTSGGVCFQLTGLAVQCVPTFSANQQIMPGIIYPDPGTIIIYGIARADVQAIQAVFPDGTQLPATLNNDAYFLELQRTPTHLLIQLANGTTTTEHIPQCPPSTPACANP